MNPKIPTGKFAKFIVSVMGGAATSLQTYYGTSHWVPPVLAGITAIAVYLVPNNSN